MYVFFCRVLFLFLHCALKQFLLQVLSCGAFLKTNYIVAWFKKVKYLAKKKMHIVLLNQSRVNFYMRLISSYYSQLILDKD